jgi:uncharacterized protein
MLKVDLGQLERKGRIRIDETVPAEDPLLEASGLELAGGLDVGLVVSQAGKDVLVRGRLRGEALLECRRCLKAVRKGFDEEVTLLYRAGVTATEAEAEEVYPLPERAREIDLSPAIREHVILAVPQYPLCSEACRGLCPRCGADLNEGRCGCEAVTMDPRWAALRQNTE